MLHVGGSIGNAYWREPDELDKPATAGRLPIRGVRCGWLMEARCQAHLQLDPVNTAVALPDQRVA
jgi:hypothetical protein